MTITEDIKTAGDVLSCFVLSPVGYPMRDRVAQEAGYRSWRAWCADHQATKLLDRETEAGYRTPPMTCMMALLSDTTRARVVAFILRQEIASTGSCASRAPNAP